MNGRNLLGGEWVNAFAFGRYSRPGRATIRGAPAGSGGFTRLAVARGPVPVRRFLQLGPIGGSTDDSTDGNQQYITQLMLFFCAQLGGLPVLQSAQPVKMHSDRSCVLCLLPVMDLPGYWLLHFSQHIYLMTICNNSARFNVCLGKCINAAAIRTVALRVRLAVARLAEPHCWNEHTRSARDGFVGGRCGGAAPAQGRAEGPTAQNCSG